MAKTKRRGAVLVVEPPEARVLDTDIYTLTVLQGGERRVFRVFHHTPDDAHIAFLLCEECQSKTCGHALAVQGYIKDVTQGHLKDATL